VASIAGPLGALNISRGPAARLSQSASIPVSVTVFIPAAIMVTPSVVAATFAIIAATVVHHRGRRIVTRRFIDHRGSLSPAKRVDIDVDASIGVGGRACHQRERDEAK